MGALGKVTGFWEGLTGPSRRLLIAAVVIFIVGIFALMRFSGQESYATLATASSASDAAAITTQLDELGIRYKLADGGNVVQVPSAELDQARIDLAASNVLDGGSTVGFEIFDKSNLGATDFTNRVNLLRAREGDLSRIIGRLDPVQSATVKIGMPEEQLFTEEQEPTTAAVVLTMRAGQTLEPGQVKGIAKLVAMAVPGMKIADVTITDSQGNILEGADAEVSGASAASQRIELEGRYERSVQARLDAMLAAVLGPGKAVTQVRAQLDLDKVTTDSEEFEGETIPLETETSEETLTSEGGGSGATAGTSANTPAGTTYPAGAIGGGTTDYSKTSEATRNGIDRIRSQVEKTPGAVTKQTVSVQVSDQVPAATIASLEDTIAAAVGFDQARGDTISVNAVAFAEDGTAVTSAAAAAEAAKDGGATASGGGLDIMGLAKTAAAGIGLLLLALFARKSLKRRQTDLEKALPELLKRGPVSVAELSAASGGAPVRQLEGQRKTAIEAQMEDLAKRKPDDVAQLLRGWLLENR
ncbi:flagellar basal-body MS-ring/collar protein FliF [Miltoncostaea oceani]|uniref:flagellar basal-body MS-ring/collar protein FliF n=1 Tax=Miltoncostaea oceani TaxID=2843216 RepID=UPI001C3E22B4|nr:flagellar basal-body MS-ring/collar protein FliF [Miltoncostaea oceani]